MRSPASSTPVWAALVAAVCGVSADAAVLSVPADHATIQAAIDAAAAGDEIVVAAGVYNEFLTWYAKNLILRSSGGAEVTSITGGAVGEGPTVDPHHVVLDPPRNRVLVSDVQRNAIYAIDLSTGDRSILSDATHGVGPTLGPPVRLAVDLSNSDLYVSSPYSATLFRIDLLSGDRSIVSDASIGSGPLLQFPRDIALDLANGRALIADMPPGDPRIMAVDLVTGDRTVLASTSIGTGSDFYSDGGMALDLSNGRLLILTAQSGEGVLLGIDLLSGNRTLLVSNGTGTGDPIDTIFLDLQLTSTNRVWALEHNSQRIFELDPSTGNHFVVEEVTLGSGPTLYGSSQFILDESASRLLFADSYWGGVLSFDLSTNVRSVISATPFPAVLTCTALTSASRLEGFTITGGIRNGGIASNTSLLTLQHCIVAGNRSEYQGVGAGLYSSSGSLTLLDCLFLDNEANEGASIFAYFPNSLSFSRCVFSQNSASPIGAVLIVDFQYVQFPTSLVFDNCLFTGNMGGVSAVQIRGGTSLFENCTFYANESPGGGYALAGTIGTTVRNCILWGNGPNPLNVGEVTYSNVEGGHLGLGNLDADPQFMDGSGLDGVAGTLDDDLRLLSTSPSVNAGDPTTGVAGVDFDGNPRLQQCLVDQGAFESAHPGTDCNGNGTGDACDLTQGNSLDTNDTQVPDECEGLLAYNQTQDLAYPTLSDAVAAASSGDHILAPSSSFAVSTNLDFADKALRIESLGGLLQPSNGLYFLSDGSQLVASAEATLALFGWVRAGFDDAIRFFGDKVHLYSTGLLELAPAATLEIVASQGLVSEGEVSSYGAAIASANGIVNLDGDWTLYGDLMSDIGNHASMLFVADTQIVGDLDNYSTGVLTIQNGTLTILGSFNDQGTTIGDVASLPKRDVVGDLTQKRSGHALSVLGDYSLRSEATLHSPSGQLTVKVGGDFDVALEDHLRFDLAQAELRMIGLGASPQLLETMSKRIGKDLTAYDRNLPGHYPLGTLRIGPTATTVSLVDQHDNDGQGQQLCEALYVHQLIIDSGATLLTNDCRIYYEQLTLLGSVDDPDHLIDIHSATDVDEPLPLPTVTRLSQNVPNPFNPATEIHFDLARDLHARLEIFDSLGRRVRVLVDEPLPRGSHRVRWLGDDERGRPVASGVYLYRLRAGQLTQTLRALLLR